MSGLWSMVGLPLEASSNVTTISFPLHLTNEPTLNFVEEGETGGAGCTGGTAAAPKADPGNICIYTAALLGSTEPEHAFGGAVGKNLKLGVHIGAELQEGGAAVGSWAAAE